ncbi:sensor histidine kinase [Colwellia sp. RE-S-Sl-9]
MFFVNWKSLIRDKDKLFWLMHTIGWFGFALVHYLGSLLHDLRDIFIVIVFLNAYSGWMLTVPLRYIYRYVWNFKPIQIALSLIVVSFVTGVIWQVIKNLNYWEIYQHGYRPEYLIYYTKFSLWSFYIVISWSVLYFGLKYYQMLQNEKQNVLTANTEAHQAQLKMLRYQLNPHFLFNTLNAISTLILVKDNIVANAMVTKLSDFLRYTLDKDPMKKVTLESEIQVLTLYLDIEKVRFEERLQVVFDIDENCNNALVPSMILQPIAENAIKHAISVQEEGGTISVAVKAIGQYLFIELSDDGPGAVIINNNLHRENGIGLVNTRERLQALFDNDYSLIVSNNMPKGVKVSIRIPLQVEAEI